MRQNEEKKQHCRGQNWRTNEFRLFCSLFSGGGRVLEPILKKEKKNAVLLCFFSSLAASGVLC
jgi:hypothetical protein